MSEWLTTGQMINKLKIGEKAECMEHELSTQVGRIIEKQKDGSLMGENDLGELKYLSLNRETMEAKWRILPNYVSFEEAMKALREGKTVSVHIDGKTFKVSHYEAVAYRLSALEFEHYGLIPLMNDKWTIEE